MAVVTPEGFVVVSVVVKADGSPIPDDFAGVLVSVQVEDNRSVPDTFELRFRDSDGMVYDRSGLKLGGECTVGVGAAEEAPTWLITGEVTSMETEIDAGGTWTVVRGYDKSHRLMRGRRVEVHLKSKVSDVISAVASRAGLSADVAATTEVHDWIVQSNISDWDFVEGLCRDNGLELSVREGTLHAKPPPATSQGATLGVEYGVNIIHMRAAITAAEHVDSVEVRAWDSKNKNVLVGTGSAKTSAGARVGVQPSAVAKSFSPPPMRVTDAPYVATKPGADALAQALAARVAGAFTQLEATVLGHPSFASGKVIQLKGCGNPYDGDWVITSVRHVVADGAYSCTVIVSGAEDRTLFGLVSDRGQRRAPGTVGGLVPAIVTNNNDPEKLGRVKLKFPWLDDNLESDWARTVQMGGGSGGSLMIPEVDDEVLVGFEQGYLSRAFVLGGLYNGKDKPVAGDVAEFVGGGKVKGRTFASRTKHRLELMDDPSKDGVLLVTGDGNLSLRLDKKGTTIQVKSNGKVEISGDTDISMKAGGNAVIEATGNLDLKATGNVTVKATGNLKAEATGTFEASGMTSTVKGQTTAELSAPSAAVKGTAMTTIQGALVKIN